MKKQGCIHGSISRRVGRGSMVAGQGQKLKSALLLALNTQRQEVITHRRTNQPTDGPTDIVTYRVACTRLKIQVSQCEHSRIVYVLQKKVLI